MADRRLSSLRQQLVLLDPMFAFPFRNQVTELHSNTQDAIQLSLSLCPLRQREVRGPGAGVRVQREGSERTRATSAELLLRLRPPPPSAPGPPAPGAPPGYCGGGGGGGGCGGGGGGGKKP